MFEVVWCGGCEVPQVMRRDEDELAVRVGTRGLYEEGYADVSIDSVHEHIEFIHRAEGTLHGLP